MASWQQANAAFRVGLDSSVRVAIDTRSTNALSRLRTKAAVQWTVQGSGIGSRSARTSRARQRKAEKTDAASKPMRLGVEEGFYSLGSLMCRFID